MPWIISGTFNLHIWTALHISISDLYITTSNLQETLRKRGLPLCFGRHAVGSGEYQEWPGWCLLCWWWRWWRRRRHCLWPGTLGQVKPHNQVQRNVFAGCLHALRRILLCRRHWASPAYRIGQQCVTINTNNFTLNCACGMVRKSIASIPQTKSLWLPHPICRAVRISPGVRERRHCRALSRAPRHEFKSVVSEIVWKTKYCWRRCKQRQSMNQSRKKRFEIKSNHFRKIDLKSNQITDLKIDLKSNQIKIKSFLETCVI